MDKETIEQPEKCSKCGSFPEDILMLACSHDLCLNCAAKTLQKSENKYARQPTNSLICDICGTSTHLDQSSIYELEKINISNNLNINKNSNFSDPVQKNNNFSDSVQKGSNGFSKTPTRSKEQAEKYKVQPPLNSNELRGSSVEKTNFNFERSQGQDGFTNRSLNSQFLKCKASCSDHPEEEISYFCFNCLTTCICPECIIHGVHKNHEVMTIRKSYPIIKSKIDDFAKQLNVKIEDYKSNQENLRGKKRDQYDQNKSIKKTITDFFGELKAKIEYKEKEIIKTADQNLELNIKEIDNEITYIESNISQLFTELDSLNSHLNAKDEATVLNFYASHIKSVESKVFTHDLNTHKMNEPNFFDVKDLQVQLNSLTDQVSSITTLGITDNNRMINKANPINQYLNNNPNNNNNKYSPSPMIKNPNYDNDENNVYEYERAEKMNFKNSSMLSGELKPPKSNFQQFVPKNEKKSDTGFNNKILKPFNNV